MCHYFFNHPWGCATIFSTKKVEQSHQISQIIIQYLRETMESSLSELLRTGSTGPEFQMLQKIAAHVPLFSACAALFFQLPLGCAIISACAAISECATIFENTVNRQKKRGFMVDLWYCRSWSMRMNLAKAGSELRI